MNNHRRTLKLLGFVGLIAASWLGVSQVVHGQCNWEETQKLIAADGAIDDYYGQSVSISGDVMIAGVFGVTFSTSMQ